MELLGYRTAKVVGPPAGRQIRAAVDPVRRRDLPLSWPRTPPRTYDFLYLSSLSVELGIAPPPAPPRMARGEPSGCECRAASGRPARRSIAVMSTLYRLPGRDGPKPNGSSDSIRRRAFSRSSIRTRPPPARARAPHHVTGDDCEVAGVPIAGPSAGANRGRDPAIASALLPGKTPRGGRRFHQPGLRPHGVSKR